MEQIHKKAYGRHSSKVTAETRNTDIAPIDLVINTLSVCDWKNECVWACATWSMPVLIQSDARCSMRFVCALWPPVIGYRVTEGHARASVSSEYCLVKLFYVVMQFCLCCCQSASASACQGILLACSVIKERARVFWEVRAHSFARITYLSR